MRELIVDSFAGGGGASLGITWALGRGPDVAINHDQAAIDMHAANHPETTHFTSDVWGLSPRQVTRGRPVGLLWASPDCCHFSRAKGAKPVKKEIRSLAWVVVKWASEVQPRVIILENVREFAEWGPLVPRWECGCGWKGTEGQAVLARVRRRCPLCNSAKLSVDYRVMVPDPHRKGLTFRRWVGRLRNLGYRVEWKNLDAADFGAPTHRKRLFLVARRDDKPIIWPEATHGDPNKLNDMPLFGALQPWRTAAECIDWSIPCPSIFDRHRPLAENTMRRIAMGIKRYVLDNPNPFIVQVNHGGAEFRGQDLGGPLPAVTGKHGFGVVVPHITKFRQNSVGSAMTEPLPTVTSGAGATRPAGAAHAMGLVSATIVGVGGRMGQSPPADLAAPVNTVTAKNDKAIVTPFVARLGQTGGNGTYTQRVDEPIGTMVSKAEHLLVAPVISSLAHGGRGTFGDSRSHGIEEPIRTVHAGGNNHALVAAFLAKHFGGVVGHAIEQPASTVTAKDHHSVVAANLIRFNHDDAGVPVEAPLPTVTANNHAALVYSFMVKYFGTAIGTELTAPMPTATGKDRFGLVTVMIAGEPYVIVDIGMRMLSPRELARAQGFPDEYVLTGPKSNQVARIGNSVCPVMAKVLVEVNYAPEKVSKRQRVS